MFALIKELFWKAAFGIAVVGYIYHLMMPYFLTVRPMENGRSRF